MQHLEEETLSLLKLANAQEEEQAYQAAYNTYSQIVQTEPSLAAARLGKGRCAARLNKDIVACLQEACEEIQQAYQLSPLEAQEKTKTAWALTETVLFFIKNLEDEYQKQLFNKLNASERSHFSSSLFGGALKQSKLDTINQEQNQHFQSLIPLFARTLQLAWAISNDQKTASQITAILNQIKDSSVLLQHTIRQFEKSLTKIKPAIDGQTSTKITQKDAIKTPALWLVLAALALVILLIWIAYTR